MDEFYWLGFYELGKGSVVNFGNWGRIKKVSFVGSPNVVKELLFDNVRLKYFPSYPSRLASIFLCPSFEEIAKYRIRNNKASEVIHKVKILNPQANRIITDWSKANFNPNESLEAAEQRAIEYWTAKEIQNPEVLIESAIEIVDICK